MRNILGVFAVAFAVGKKPTTWLIDGNNFLGQKGTPRKADVLTEKLKPVALSDSVVLVFDGRPGDSRTEQSEGSFRTIKLEEGMSADDFILEEIQTIAAESKQNRVKLVTADKRLRSFALDSRPTVKTVVNPLVFWRKYYPRMSGMKKRIEDEAEE
jgi:hypothetical protein